MCINLFIERAVACKATVIFNRTHRETRLERHRLKLGGEGLRDIAPATVWDFHRRDQNLELLIISRLIVLQAKNP